jgi:hypothetical protein
MTIHSWELASAAANGVSSQWHNKIVHPEHATCRWQDKAQMNAGWPILRVFAKGGILDCSSQDLFFPPLPNGGARMGHPAFPLFIRTEADPDFLLHGTHQRPRVRLSDRKQNHCSSVHRAKGLVLSPLQIKGCPTSRRPGVPWDRSVAKWRDLRFFSLGVIAKTRRRPAVPLEQRTHPPRRARRHCSWPHRCSCARRLRRARHG